ncbi:hypothetical protein NB689_002968 [Xanthomonas sacchari]|nr:hypothetical protein [Xanthomonas sacchari]
MYASGAISMTFFSSSLTTFSTPSISYSASYSGRR